LPLKRNLVEKNIQLMQIHEYLENQLRNTGFAGIDLQKTAMGLRITIKTAYPGSVIGNRGIKIKQLTADLEKKFGLQNPQIDVFHIKKPELNAQIMAEAIASGIRKGQNFRKTAYSVMRRIMKAGARGVEVRISGKTTSQRARTLVFRAGIISKCGIPAIEGVSTGIAEAIMKLGIIGVQVKIMPLDYRLPDEIIMKAPNLPDLKKYKADEIISEDYIIDKGSAKIIKEEEEEEESIFDIEEGETIEKIEVENEKEEIEVEKNLEKSEEKEESIEKVDEIANEILKSEELDKNITQSSTNIDQISKNDEEEIKSSKAKRGRKKKSE